MKNFSDLTKDQKKIAIDKAYKANVDNLIKGKGDVYNSLQKSYKDKLEKIKFSYSSFCGCGSCMAQAFEARRFVNEILNQDPELKEKIIGQATKSLEIAYYAEEGDLVIDIK